MRIWIHEWSDCIGVIKRPLLLQERECMGAWEKVNLQFQIQNCTWNWDFENRVVRIMSPIMAKSYRPMGLLRTIRYRVIGLSINKTHLSSPPINLMIVIKRVERSSTMFILESFTLSLSCSQKVLSWIETNWTLENSSSVHI